VVKQREGKLPLDPILLKPPIELPPSTEPVSLYPAEPRPQPVPDPEIHESSPIPLPPAADGNHLAVAPEKSIAESPDVVPPIELGPEQIVLGPAKGPLGQIVELIAWLVSRVFGAITLIVGLSFLAAYPVVQVFSLGYLLEAAGRIGRTGKLRDAFPLVREASRIGVILLGSWLVILPWRFTTDLVADASLIDEASQQTQFLNGVLGFLTIVTPPHILFAVLRGGRLRYFFWPFNVVWFVRRVFRGGYFQNAWCETSRMFRELRVLHYFYLGLRGGLGAFVWLAIPSTLYAVGRSEKTAVFGIIGGALLTWIVLYLPFLQIHFATENRFRAMFEVGKVRERFRRAPIAFLIAFVFTLLLVLPLYLLKVEVVPRDALWLPSLVFIITIFPLKVMTGWAYGRAGHKEKHAHFIFRLGCRLLMLPIAFFYAVVVFFVQYTGWHGVRALYEHHAFLLPVPF